MKHRFNLTNKKDILLAKSGSFGRWTLISV